MTTKTFTWRKGKETEKIKVIGKGVVGEKGCPQCNSMGVIPTGKLLGKDRTYICRNCDAKFASPTTWAKCTNGYITRTQSGLIGKDLIYNDCLICPISSKEGFDIKQLVKEGKKCPYFQGD